MKGVNAPVDDDHRHQMKEHQLMYNMISECLADFFPWH